MPLGTSPALRKVFADRLTGDDGVYSSWELAFFAGYDPKNAGATLYSAPLVVFPFSGSWSYYDTNSGVTMFDPQTKTVTTPGECTFFRFNAVVAGSPIALLHGNVSKSGEGGDIQFSTVGWPIGLPVTLSALYLRPPPLSN